jgi:hypothetical protein
MLEGEGAMNSGALGALGVHHPLAIIFAIYCAHIVECSQNQ